MLINSTDIEVDRKCFKSAMRGYHGVHWYSMHTVFAVTFKLPDLGDF